MGRIKFILSLCFALLLCTVHAQSNTVMNISLEQSIPGTFSKFFVDNMGNIFVLLNDNIQIKKLSPNGDSLQLSDNLNQYGNIYSMDVTNPLKILVYYKDFTTILVLDRFLNVINTIDLKQAGIMQARAFASSYDGNMWVYDELNAQIKKLDAAGTVLFTSTDLRNVFADAPDPSTIIDNNGQLYLYDTQMGWLLFDYYGAYKQQLNYPYLNDVSVTNNILCGRCKDTVWMYNQKNMIGKSFSIPGAIPADSIKQIHLMGNKLFLLSNEGINVYDIKL